MLHTVAEKQQQEARGPASNRTWVQAALRSAPLVPAKTGAALGLQQERDQQQEGASDSTAAGTASQDLPQREVMDNLVNRLAAPEDSR